MPPVRSTEGGSSDGLSAQKGAGSGCEPSADTSCQKKKKEWSTGVPGRSKMLLPVGHEKLESEPEKQAHARAAGQVHEGEGLAGMGY